MEPTMKMNKHILLAAAAAGVLLSGCVKEKGVEPGSAINFSASSAALETRTVYGANASTGQRQYIDWVSGDKMTIAKVHESATQACDYSVSTRTASTGSGESVATVTSSPATGQSALTWNGEGSHTFYAMYPAGTLSENVLSGTVAATQTADMNMPSGYMFATTTVNVGPTYTVKTVDLEFAPAFSAFEFTLKNTSESPVKLSRFELSSLSSAGAMEPKLNGDISYTFGSGVSFAGTTTTDTEKTIIVQNVTVPANSAPLTFVITTLPNTFSSLKVRIYNESGDDVKTLTMTPSGGFTGYYKHNITITLPKFTEWTYDCSVTDPTLVYSGGTSDDATVTSSRIAGSDSESLYWEVEGFYTDASCTDKLSSRPSWLGNNFPMSGTGDASFSFSYSGDSSPVASQSAAAVTNASILNSDFGSGSTSSAPYNLSNPDDMTSSDIVESANCYIVNGAGYYKIPLVMGNSIKNKGSNLDNCNHSKFTNYSGNAISDPYLKNQVNGKTPQSPDILWTDCSGLVGDLSVSSDKCWLHFSVGQGDTPAQQGNAIIKVTDGTDVMWSYHIWVTDYVPRNYSAYSSSSKQDIAVNDTYKIAPINLGWVTSGGNATLYREACVYAKFVFNNDENRTAVMQIRRPAYTDMPLVLTGGSPYYEWGRKDPFPYTSSLVSTYIGNYYTNGTGLSISVTIKDPLYKSSSSLGRQQTNQYMLWRTDDGNGDSGQTTLVGSHKTIYDPCPVGYSVPVYNSFSTLSKDNEFTSSNPVLKTSSGTKLFFPMAGYLSNVIIDSSTYGRYWYASTQNTGYNNGKMFYFGTSTNPAMANYSTGYGLLVRPMWDSSQ